MRDCRRFMRFQSPGSELQSQVPVAGELGRMGGDRQRNAHAITQLTYWRGLSRMSDVGKNRSDQSSVISHVA